MAKVIRGKFDLFTLCCKNQLIGTEIQLEDETWVVVGDWYCDFKTNEIHLNFKNGEEGDSFDLGEKFVVKIDSAYKVVKSKKKKRNAKKRKS